MSVSAQRRKSKPLRSPRTSVTFPRELLQKCEDLASEKKVSITSVNSGLRPEIYRGSIALVRKGIRMSGAFQLLATKTQEASSRITAGPKKPSRNQTLPFPGRMALYPLRKQHRLHEIIGRRQHEFIITSPPYNLRKAYETKKSMDVYVDEQRDTIKEAVRLLTRRAQSAGKLETMSRTGRFIRSTSCFIQCSRKRACSCATR